MESIQTDGDLAKKGPQWGHTKANDAEHPPKSELTEWPDVG